jgi:hypothetical protein
MLVIDDSLRLLKDQSQRRHRALQNNLVPLLEHMVLQPVIFFEIVTEER